MCPVVKQIYWPDLVYHSSREAWERTATAPTDRRCRFPRLTWIGEHARCPPFRPPWIANSQMYWFFLLDVLGQILCWIFQSEILQLWTSVQYLINNVPLCLPMSCHFPTFDASVKSVFCAFNFKTPTDVGIVYLISDIKKGVRPNCN